MIDYNSYIGQIRLTIGDLDETSFNFTNAQLQAYYDMYGNVILASIGACRAWITLLNSSAGDIYRIDTIEYQEGKSKATSLQSLLNSLEKSVSEGNNPMLIGLPITTGIRTADREMNQQKIKDGTLISHPLRDDDYDLIDLTPNDRGPYYQA